MTSSPAVKIQGVQHYFGQGNLRKQVLFENQLQIEPGEIVIMTGPSGSGKTTLLTLIGTLRSVQEGSLEVLGQQLLGASDDDRIALRRRIGFIFQAHNLFESLTAFQNVKMALDLLDLGPAEVSTRIRDLLTRLGMGHRIDFKPASLSGGQKQRVAVARGLAHRPKLILADEPTAALDEKSGREVVTMFQEFAQQEGAAILLVTHDNRILDVADRIVRMVDGRIKSNVLVQESRIICEFLKEVPVFSKLTPRTLTDMADKMFLETFPPGATVIRQGDAGDKFYLIREGRVKVEVERDGLVRQVAELSQGSFFGEAALINHEPRNASVVATTDLQVYTLGPEDFQRSLDASATLEEEVRKVLFERQ